jgi:putative phage-type endonuclease
MTEELIQGSPEWRAARCGSLGASAIADATARIKSGWGASRANLMATLLTERLTGSPVEGYQNAAMQWGIENEPLARAAYEFIEGVEVKQVGMVKHPTIQWTHASPDGLVGNDGLVEIKCPQTSTHIETLLGSAIDGKYVKQCQWQMACTGRIWCDLVSFDPRLPANMQLAVKRIRRDDEMIAGLESDVAEFLAELDGKMAALKAKYAEPANLMAAG